MSIRLVEETSRRLAPLASESTLSWSMLAIYCPAALVPQAVGNAASFGGPLGLWALASVIGMLAMVAVLHTTRRATVSQGGPSLGVVLAAFVVASFLQALVFGVAAIALGATSVFPLAFRLTAPLWQVPLLMALGFAVSGHAAHRRVIAEMEDKRARLLAVGPSIDAELDRLEGDLAAAVRTSLEPALSSLDDALSHVARGTGAGAAAAALNAIVEDEVRPISRELVLSRPGLAFEQGPGADAQATARVPIPPRFVVARGVRPVLAAAAMTVVAVATALRDLDALPAGLFLLALAPSLWAALYVGRRAMGTRTAPTALGVALVILLHMAVFPAVLALFDRVGIPTPIGGSVPGSVVFAAIGAFIVGAMLVGERRAESEAALVLATDRLDEAVARLLRRQALVRRRLAFVLHGSLQGVLYAAALRVREGAALDEAQVDQIRHDVARALGELGAPRPSGRECRMKTMVNELTEVWKGRRRVTAHVAPGMYDVLTGDPDADEAVAEVIREAVNNAFIHGGATTVTIDVEPVAGAFSHGVAICVRDNGRAPGGEGSPGVGSALLGDLCRSWQLTGSEHGSIFRAEVAVAQSDGAPAG